MYYIDMLGKVLLIILVVIGILAIIVILFQGGKAQGLGGTLTGTSDSNLFDNSKENLSDKRPKQLTWFLISLFILVAIILVILIHTGKVTI